MKDCYDIIERDGKIEARVWALTERELFSRALLALAAVFRPDAAHMAGEAVNVRAHVHGENFLDTLERFLSRVLFETEMHRAIFSAMHIIHLASDEIECELVGKKTNHLEEEIEELNVRHDSAATDAKHKRHSVLIEITTLF